jgi:hypothetical protein
VKRKNQVARLEARQKAFDSMKVDERRRYGFMHRPGSFKK